MEARLVIARIKLSYLATVAVAVLLLFAGHRIAVQNLFIFQNDMQEVVRATVRGVMERVQPEGDDLDDFLIMMQGERLFFEAEIRRGPRRGETVTAVQTFGGFVQDIANEVREGDSILLISFGDEWFFNGQYRTNRLLGLGLLFVICVILFGGKKGFNTILSLGLTCAAVFAFLYLPYFPGETFTLRPCLYARTQR